MIGVVNSVSAVVLAVAMVIFFAGVLFYVFSSDFKHHKDRGVYLTSLAVAICTVVLIVLLLIN